MSLLIPTHLLRLRASSALLRPASLFYPIITCLPSTPASPRLGYGRSYAVKRAKNVKSSTTDSGDRKGKGKGKEKENDISDEAQDEENLAVLSKAEAKMDKSLDWCRGIVYDEVQRGKGLVNPSILDGIKIKSPHTDALEPLVSVASVTVKNQALYVEVFDAESMKAVESALHKANLPGLSVQKYDSRNIKIPVARPTQDIRTAILKSLSATSESAKQQIRLARTEALKHVKEKNGWYGKKIQEATDKRSKGLDELMEQAKRELAK